MSEDQIIAFTKKFMEETKGHTNFRAGGNLGRVIAGYLVATEIRQLNIRLIQLIEVLGKQQSPVINVTVEAEAKPKQKGKKND